MRFHSRRLAVLLAAASLICFGSCERHKPEELHHGGHAAGDATEHTANVIPTHQGDVAAPHESAAPPVEHSAPHVSPTPAQFFPSATPTP